MKKLISICALAAFVLCSCSTLQTVSYTESRSVEPTHSMHAVPLIADLQVSDTRITYTERVTLDLSNVTDVEAKQFIEDLKSTVLSRALKAYKAEVMVAPIIEVQNVATTILEISVSGYPATYKNIRSATKEDSWFIPVVEPSIQEVPAPASKGFKLLGK